MTAFCEAVLSAYHPDQRDATPEPPAMLDPWWVIRMRERLRSFQETGKIEDWYPASPGRSAPDGAVNIEGGN